jgi:hypothetical protein
MGSEWELPENEITGLRITRSLSQMDLTRIRGGISHARSPAASASLTRRYTNGGKQAVIIRRQKGGLPPVPLKRRFQRALLFLSRKDSREPYNSSQEKIPESLISLNSLCVEKIQWLYSVALSVGGLLEKILLTRTNLTAINLIADIIIVTVSCIM